ncbi:MAG TPA: high-affinity branched-chain amino acid ABC transporter permease LivM [Bauldia sp.]|nr:high-affinity branched-chain amino acid ABC transporter permease LivM [Bauldia sp.]
MVGEHRANFPNALKEGLIAGGVALALFGPFLGLLTAQNVRNELILVTRPGLLAIAVAIVGIGRFLIAYFYQPYAARRRAAPTVVRPASPWQVWLRRYFAPLAIVLLVLYPPIVLGTSGIQGSIKWVDNFGVQILIYVMLAWGLNIVVGLAGLLDLGYVAFYAVGAYSYTLLAIHFDLSFWILLPIAGLLAALWGVLLGFPVLRLRGDYLAIVTLAFGEIVRLVLINWRDVTKGGFGITSIPKITFFGMPFDASPAGFAAHFGLPLSSAYYKIFMYYLILALALLTAWITIRLRRLPIGRAWESLREDEIACRSLGINTTSTKLTAFATGAMFAGFAGSFFAARQGFISPESFTFIESAMIVAIVVLGGMGSIIGVAVAAVAMIGGIESLRELTILKQVFGQEFEPTQYRMLLFGLAMVLIMLWKPRGFVTARQPTAFLKERRTISGSLTKEGHG